MRRRRQRDRPGPDRPLRPDLLGLQLRSLRRQTSSPRESGTTYLAAMVRGHAGLMQLSVGRQGQAAHRRRRPARSIRGTRRRRPPGRRCAPAARSSTSSSSCARTAPTTRSSATTRARQRRPHAGRLRRRSVTPNMHALVDALPAARPRLRQLRGLDRGALLDHGGEGLRLRRQATGSRTTRPRAALRLRRLRGHVPGQRLPLRPGRAPGHLLLQLRRGDRRRRAALTDHDRTPRRSTQEKREARQLRPRPGLRTAATRTT